MTLNKIFLFLSFVRDVTLLSLLQTIFQMFSTKLEIFCIG